MDVAHIPQIYGEHVGNFGKVKERPCAAINVRSTAAASDILITCFCSGDWEDMPEAVRKCRWRNILGVTDCEEGICPIPEIDRLVNS